VVAAAVAGGAALTGATQQGAGRAVAATIGSALFASLVVVIIGAAGQRQVESATPTLAYALLASVCGLVGAIAASVAAVVMAGRDLRLRLAVAPAVGVGAAVLAVLILSSMTSVAVA
jgi:hypothetical protein